MPPCFASPGLLTYKQAIHVRDNPSINLSTAAIGVTGHLLGTGTISQNIPSLRYLPTCHPVSSDPAKPNHRTILVKLFIYRPLMTNTAQTAATRPVPLQRRTEQHSPDSFALDPPQPVLISQLPPPCFRPKLVRLSSQLQTHQYSRGAWKSTQNKAKKSVTRLTTKADQPNTDRRPDSSYRQVSVS
jgi:hypothetical protein